MAKKEKVAPVINSKADALAIAVAAIKKAYGGGAIMSGISQVPGVDFVSSGSLALDRALGGGWARGRIAEIYGPESCLDKDTFIQYEVRMPNGHRANHKGGTIERLWERFHGKSASENQQGKYLRPSTIGAEFFTSCMNEEGRIFTNKILDVVKVGPKNCLKVTTLDGYEIIATAEHKFFTSTGFKTLSELNPGDNVMMHKNVPFRITQDSDEQDAAIYRGYKYVKHHPVAGIKIVDGHTYYKLATARAVVEASINHLTFTQYLTRLNEGNIKGLCFLSRDDHVHHINEDITDDRLENLLVINAIEHGKLHALERHNNLRFMVVESTISAIEEVGIRETYDIKMQSPFNNFIANNFVVHNSGKTTLTLHAIAEVQKLGEIAAFVDAEHALDPAYASNLGVDMEKLQLSQPNSAEEALEITRMLVSSGAVGIVVVDSVAALVPQQELEKLVGDAVMGRQANMMSQAMRMLAGKTHNTNTIVMFINQIRMKIGVMFGNPETTSGGNALKFYASQRVDVRRTDGIKEGDVLVANKTRAKVVKNKVFPPFKEAIFNIKYGEGIDRIEDLLTVGEEIGLVSRSGPSYTVAGQKAIGRAGAATLLREKPELCETIKEQALIGLQSKVTETVTEDEEEVEPLVVAEDSVV